MDLMTNEEQKPEENPEVESILSDLDVVLSEMGVTGASPAPAPAPAPILPPIAKTPPIPRNTSPSQGLKIELGPAKGISSPSARQVSPSSSPPQKKGTSPSPAAYKPPFEIKLDVVAPAKPPERSQAAAPSKSVVPPSSAVPANPPAPSETFPRTPGGEYPPSAAGKDVPPFPAAAVPEAVPGAKAAAKASPAAAPLIHATVAPVEIPENASKDQIRPLAFLFMAGGKAKFDEFIQFIDSMSLHFGKKPLYLRRAVVLELPAAVDFQAVVNEVRASGAAGTVGLLPDSIARGLEEAFSQAGSFFRFVRPEDAGKRSAALDLLVDVTLLPAG